MHNTNGSTLTFIEGNEESFSDYAVLYGHSYLHYGVLDAVGRGEDPLALVTL